MKQEAHVYIPEDLRVKIPPLYSSESVSDPTAWVKLFTPDSSWTWYLLEASAVMKDGEYRPINRAPEHIVWDSESNDITDVICFGLVIGHEAELGYFSLAEITAARGPLGLRVERDLFFIPKPLSQVRAQHERPRS